MATIVKDLGAVTAYAYAVEKGYTGTEDEFAELMASYADVAEQAAESAAQAGASATAAEQAKANAVLSASAAATSASTASTKASEAASSASSAAGAANTATTKASEASASATSAASSASAAATSATNAGASETAAASSATAASNAQTAAETAQGKAEDAQTAAEDAAEQAGIYAAGYLKAFPVDTASGAVANFPDGADELPVKDLTVDIEPVQSGSGDPSPDNVRPISGWTGANVTRTGKNLYNLSNQVAQQVKTYLAVDLPHNIDFVFSTDKQINGLYAAYSDAEIMPSITGSSWTNINYIYNTTSLSFNSGVHKWYRLMTYEQDGVQSRTYQLELGSTATAYEPYNANTYSITFPASAGTVYGGTLDVTTGKLTVEYVKKTISSFSGAFGAVVKGYAAYVMDAETDHQNVSKPSCMVSNIFKYTNESQNYANVFEYGGSDGGSSTQVFILPSTITSVAEANAWLSGLGTPLECTFKLATPIVYDLTPTEVTTLLATNNVWADAGDSTVEYRADPTLYINKKIAALAAAMN